MLSELQQIESAIAGLESQRALLGDAVADAALVPLRARRAALAGTLTTPASPAQTRRQVTILFLDIVGSTALSQQLDAEDIHAVMDGALARCTSIVAAQGGKVLQYAGDSLLAAFGADEAREDDPDRAVHAGLALLAEGRALGLEVLGRHGHRGFDVRVGVHTGDVLLGGGVDAEGSIRGIAVNVAARMEQTAPAGALRISHDTYRHVRGVFDVEPQPAMLVKGIDAPVATYLVLRAKPRAFRVASRGIEGVETRMIGRDAELEILQVAFARLFSERRLSVVTVVAEAGLGKSRLLYEFGNWTETRPERFCLFQGRANPQARNQPYGLLRDIVARRLQFADSDSVSAAKTKIELGIALLFEADDGADMAQAHAHLLGHLIGLDFSDSRHVNGILDDARQIRNRGFHAAALMFRRATMHRGSPIVLQVEDLHWADEGSLDFLDYLSNVNRDLPMLMVCLTRPTLFERRESWREGDDHHRRIDLDPLDKGASRILANELLKKLPVVPDALRELVVGAAEGNPFFMEETVKMLVDKGALETAVEGWSVHPEKLLATPVPQSLTGVLQARLDGLPPQEKLALQQASVIGPVFWDQALAALDAAAPEALPTLVQRELILLRVDAALDRVREYVFKHQILHQVTYDTLLKRSRREWHAKAAAWLAQLTGARAADLLGAAAEHYEHAGDSPNACEYFARAAERAMAGHAHELVRGHVARALALLDADDAAIDLPTALALRWRLLGVRESTLELQGRRGEQRADLDAMQRVADALHDDHRRAMVAWRQSQLAMRIADYRSEELAARQTMTLAERAGDDELKLEGLRQLASATTELGDMQAGRALAQDGLTQARSRGLLRVQGVFLNLLASIAGRQGDNVAALQIEGEGLKIWRKLGNQPNEAKVLGNLGTGWLQLGALTQARRHVQESLKLGRTIGDLVAQCSPLLNLSTLALWLGDDAQALAHARAALDIAVVVQAPNFEAAALVRLGEAELALGRLVAAADAFERAESVARAIGSALQHDATAGRARVALATGDMAAAIASVQTLLDHLDGGGTLVGTLGAFQIELTCHQVLARACDPRAEELLAGTHVKLQAMAATIPDAALRQGFLSNVPAHREVLAAWAAGQAASAEPG
jgi:class 3 adenylate cyclase/tetratricopeptide (TPR) repeat protein